MKIEKMGIEKWGIDSLSPFLCIKNAVMKKNLLLMFLLLAGAATASAQKFALIDMEYILQNIPAYESGMNQLEQDLVMELTALPNIRWWHRNIVRQGFAINGFINHYPDIMLMTNSGKVILAETKGDHLKNDDSRDKIEVGRAWRNAAGNQYRYYMVFRDGDNLPSGAVSMSQFLELLRAL